MNVSITIPSRLRLHLLEQCIKSWFDLAESPDLIETNVMYDSDDEPTHEFLLNIKESYPNVKPHMVTITPEMRQAGLNIHDLYFNPGARLATGKYIWGTGNDVEVKTKHYDKILCDEIEAFLQDKPDRLLYCQINHDELGSPMIPGACAFPVTTKESVETIGGTMPSEITSWGADVAMYHIYASLAQSRTLNLSDKVFIWHWSFHTGRTHKNGLSEDKSGFEGDDIAYSLSTKVQFLSPAQHNAYIRRLNAKF